MRAIKHTKDAFKNVTVHTAGKDFVECAFEHCTIVITSPAYNFDRCTINNCVFRLETEFRAGPSPWLDSVITFLQMLRGVKGEPVSHKPTLH